MTGHPYIRTTAIWMVLLLLSCSQHGETRSPTSQSSQVTLAQLQDRWEKYFIYYSTRIVVFDPISDDKTVMVQGDWIMIEDADTLADILYRLKFSPRIDPDNIIEIRGPDGDLFGYMLAAAGDLVRVKTAEANSVRLYYLPQKAPDAP